MPSNWETVAKRIDYSMPRGMGGRYCGGDDGSGQWLHPSVLLMDLAHAEDVTSVTIVTGASSGLGRQIAMSLAARGDAVVVVARRRELLDALVQEIEAAGGRARAITCDVTDPEQVSRAVALVESTDGPIERLVSCGRLGARQVPRV